MTCLTVFVWRSITDTVPDSSSDTQSSVPSGVMMKRRGRVPTMMFSITAPEAASITCTMSATSEVA